LAAARNQLVIAPETAVPLLPSQLEEVAPGYMAALLERFGAPGRAAIIGVPLGDYDRGYSNSVVGLTSGPSGQAPYRYDKQHLVPFGEFIPTGFRWFTTLLNIPLGDFMRGVRNPPSFAFAGERIAPTICYEDLYGDELALRFADEAAAPTLFANLSNIGWFGDTVAIAQHLNTSRMRTLEFQRPMLRATNTGATAIIDHRGQVVADLPTFTRGVLEAPVQGQTGITPYAWWASRAQLWPYLALGALGCLWGALRRGHRATP
jgi:apolipoprotein N-acyltransferase